MKTESHVADPTPIDSPGKQPGPRGVAGRLSTLTTRGSKDLYLIHEDLARAHIRERLQAAERRRRSRQHVRGRHHGPRSALTLLGPRAIRARPAGRRRRADH